MRTKLLVSKRQGRRVDKNVVFFFLYFVFWNKCYYEGMVAWLILEQHVLGIKAIGWKQTDLQYMCSHATAGPKTPRMVVYFHFSSFQITSCIASVLMSFSFLFCHLSFFILSFQPFNTFVSLRYLVVCTFLVYSTLRSISHGFSRPECTSV